MAERTAVVTGADVQSGMCAVGVLPEIENSLICVTSGDIDESISQAAWQALLAERKRLGRMLMEDEVREIIRCVQ